MSDDRLGATRRGVLAVAGGMTLAGCSILPSSSEPEPQLGGVEVAEAASGPVPSVPETVPVDIQNRHRQGHVDRTETLLGRAPLPFDRTEIPNGTMREEMNATAEDARTTLERAASATSPFEALSPLRDARADGRTVATAWAYADEGLRRADLADESSALVDDIASFRDRWSYVGDDPVQALLVHEPVESLLERASENADGRSKHPQVTRRPENLVTVSEDAAAIERGRAALADATHLYERLRASLSAERDLGEAFAVAAAQLDDTFRTETAAFDPGTPVSEHVDADVADSPVGRALELLYEFIARGGSITDDRDSGDVASALVSAHRSFARLAAFEDLRERAEGGETGDVERAADVAAHREAAVVAIETTLQETAQPDLSRRALHNLTGLVERVDDELALYDDTGGVSVESVERRVAEYVYAAAVARGTLPASETVAAAVTG